MDNALTKTETIMTAIIVPLVGVIGVVIGILEYCRRGKNRPDGSLENMPVGPWGHPEGHPFDHNGYDGIKRIIVWSALMVNSIEVQYTRRGEVVPTSKVGGDGGTPQPEIVLEDGEDITQVQGYYGRRKGIITSLSFTTNRNRSLGPFGEAKWTWKFFNQLHFFQFNGRIVGFHGTAGDVLSSIGVHSRPKDSMPAGNLPPPEPTPPQVVKGMYWYSNCRIAVENIDATLYTHILYASAELDPNTNMVTIPEGNGHKLSTFTSTLQRKNPSISTLLSIGGITSRPEYFSVMASNYASRQAFITSSIELARINNFFGLEISWAYPEGTTDMANYGTLLTELRVAVNTEAFDTGRTPLLLTASMYFSAIRNQDTHPVYLINTNLDWINVRSYGYYVPSSQTEFTCAPAALYNHTEAGIDCWIRMGLSPKKIAIWLPFYGFAWRLVDSNNNGIGAAADGPAEGNGIVHLGFISYKDIIYFIERKNAITNFDSSVVTNYCYAETTWIGYDDVESVKAKVLFAKNRGLLGYHAWSVDDEDDNFVLSRTAYHAWE